MRLYYLLSLMGIILSSCCDSGLNCCGGESHELGPVSQEIKALLPYQQGDEPSFATNLSLGNGNWYRDTIIGSIDEFDLTQGTYESGGDECPANTGEVLKVNMTLGPYILMLMTYHTPNTLVFDAAPGYNYISIDYQSLDSINVGGDIYPLGTIVTDSQATYTRQYFFAKGEGLVGFTSQGGLLYKKIN